MAFRPRTASRFRYGGGRVNMRAVTSAARRGAASALRGKHQKGGNVIYFALAAVGAIFFWPKIKGLFSKSV